MKEIKITKNEENQRLDKYLLKYFNKAPKSFVYKMLRKKRIKLNKGKAEGSEMLLEGDTLQLYLAEETMAGFMEEKTVPVAERHFGIVYEDDDILVVNKPAGLLTHPEKAEDRDTLTDQILYYLYEKGQYTPSAESAFTPAVCNRLDRNTSGIVVAGKTLRAVEEAGEIDLYLSKDEEHNQVRTSHQEKAGYRRALTKYRPLAHTKDYTLLELQLITGKTHQIRAHMQAMGHPVLGDRKYGDAETNRKVRGEFAISNQCLHARKIVWKEKEGFLSYLYGKQMTAPLPKNMQAVCDSLFGEEGHF